MSAYQRFLDFFSMHNKERLDGLNETYFSEMTSTERRMAFEHLLKMVRNGGTEESVNGLFIADGARAIVPTKDLLENGRLRDDAAIAAAWNLIESQGIEYVLPIFIKFFSSPDHRLRRKSAYYVPTVDDPVLYSALQGMVRVETEPLALIHAVNKLLECYGISEDTVGEKEYLEMYRALRGENLHAKEVTFAKLDAYKRKG